jgi:WXXGXW repeat (2 copies)
MKLKTWIRCCPLVFLLALPAVVPAQDDGSDTSDTAANVAPPNLPVYDQPPIPADGYVWTPGYWAWSDDDQDYYWVPGTWVQAPEAGYLWTPGYWAADGGAFLWHPGYWGSQVGFYGGVNYGHGYGGSGYQGGYWQGGHLYYNSAVSNIGTVQITNVYNKTVMNNMAVSRVSYNGGNGIRAAPTAAEQAAAQGRHIAMTPVQRQHEQTASGNPALRVSANYGTPPIAATSRPGAFSGAGVVTARHSGTMSVVGAQPRPNPQSANPQSASPQARPGAPTDQRAPEQQRAITAAPRAEAPRQTPPPRPATPPPPRAQPHPPEHPPERPPAER